MLGTVGFPILSIEVPPTWPMFANSGIKTTVAMQNIAICGSATTVVKQSNTKEDTPAGVPSFVDECVALIPFRR
jgi:hypothetical protein